MSLVFDILGLVVIALAGLALIWFVREKSLRASHPVKGGRHEGIVLPHDAPLELYANPFSHCSRKVTLAMAEYGLAFRYRQIELIETGWYQTISPAFLKINPAGLLPVLVHDGVPIFESDEILDYLGNLGTGDPLVPEEAEARARMQQWIAFCGISSDDPMGKIATHAGACIPGLTLPIFATMVQDIKIRHILVGILFHPDKKRPGFFLAARGMGLAKILKSGPAPALIRASRDAMRVHLQTINKSLEQSDGPWIMGNQLTLADISLAAIYIRLDETGWLDWFMQSDDLAAIAAHYKSWQARPSWQKAVTERRLDIIDAGRARLAEALASSAEIKSILHGAP